MTLAAKRVQTTPMAPYIGVMRGMNVSDMHIVVDFLNEAIREEEIKNIDIQFKDIELKSLPELPESIKRLRGANAVTPDDIAKDSRLAYILKK